MSVDQVSEVGVDMANRCNTSDLNRGCAPRARRELTAATQLRAKEGPAGSTDVETNRPGVLYKDTPILTLTADSGVV